MIGDVYGYWTVIGPEYTDSAYIKRCLCRCQCGTEKPVRIFSLRTGVSRSCCYIPHKKENALRRNSLYRLWKGFRQRCYNVNNPKYYLYGGRGIYVCERWQIYENFVNDIGPRPSLEHSVDRIDNDGPYSPENCRWATQKEQCRNSRSALIVEYRGVTKPLATWAEELNIKLHTLRCRIFRYGWTVERAFIEPVHRKAI